MGRTIFAFAKCQNGNIAMLFGISLFLILAGAGLAFDYQRATAIHANMQEASDAALIAAVKHKSIRPNMTDEEVRARAKAMFESNIRDLTSFTYENFDLSFDRAEDQYTLKMNTEINTLILRVLRFADLKPTIVSKAKLGKPPYLEVVMVLDNTGSMNSRGKLSNLKKSANNLVETLHASEGAEVKIGLVPFAQYVNVGTDKAGEFWLKMPKNSKRRGKRDRRNNSFMGCVGSRDYPANTTDHDYNANPVPAITGAPCPNEILALTENRAKIERAIDDMRASGWTYIPAGLIWGWRVISAEAPYTEGISSTELKKKNGIKAIILMTDGQNTKSPDYPTHNRSNIFDANKITREICDAVKDEDIIVYTIAFEVSDLTIKSLLEDCGSTPSHYFVARNAEELNSAFESIAGNLRTITLTQ